MKTVLFSAFLMLSHAIHSQCDYFPADCPETADIEAAQDSDVCIRNLIIPQEITMQNNLRTWATALMEGSAKKNNWQVYEYIEETGIGLGAEGIPTPYSLRRPYRFTISFDFIVNKDSLQAWRNWYYNDLKNASDNVIASYKQAGSDASQDANSQRSIDSMMYYTTLKAKYATDHAADYQKAILSGDTKGQKTYEIEMKKYDDRINVWINNTNDKTAQTFSGPKKQFDDLDAYKRKNTIAFRSGSEVRVTLNINENIATANDEGKKIAGSLACPGATLGLLLHNDSPRENEVFGQYARSPDVAMLLFGSWTLKPDQYHDYRSTYALDKKNTDKVTAKKIPCDRIQTVTLHVEGSPRYIHQVLESIDTQKLGNLIVKG